MDAVVDDVYEPNPIIRSNHLAGADVAGDARQLGEQAARKPDGIAGSLFVDRAHDVFGISSKRGPQRLQRRALDERHVGQADDQAVELAHGIDDGGKRARLPLVGVFGFHCSTTGRRHQIGNGAFPWPDDHRDILEDRPVRG